MKAVILCAGQGKRFQPISLVCPKPLIPISGVPLLELSLQRLNRNGIKDITLIVGYMHEKFMYLEEKYGVTLRYNSLFDSSNNNTSLALAKDLLDDCLILDGDLFFYNDTFLDFTPDRSQIISQPITAGLEWRLELSSDNSISGVTKWQPDGFGMVGVSYWTGEAGLMLAEEVQRCAVDEYWEDAALRVFQRTPVYAACIETPFLCEMDTIKNCLDYKIVSHEEVATIYSQKDFKPVKLKGLTNNTWLVSPTDGVMTTLRIPGRGTEKFIQREYEPVIVRQLDGLGITPKTSFYPDGIKTTEYLGKHRISSFKDLSEPFFRELSKMLHQMHTIEYTKTFGIPTMSIVKEIDLYERTANSLVDADMHQWMHEKALYFDSRQQVLCHRDLLLENILVSDHDCCQIQLIDFEYAGFTYYMWDLASFILEAGLDEEHRTLFLDSYKELQPDEYQDLLTMEILVDYIWSLWGKTNNYLDYADERFFRMKNKLALKF